MRKSYSAALSILLVVFVYAINDGSAAVTEPPQIATLPRPEVDLEPGEVVRIVIEALSRNDTPFKNAGIYTAYNFASPGNKANTGPLDRFVNMVNKGYSLMLNHLSSEFSEVVLEGSVAYQIVKLVAYDGTEVVYAFSLSQQQEGEYKGMWMTDAVWQISSQRSL